MRNRLIIKNSRDDSFCLISKNLNLAIRNSHNENSPSRNSQKKNSLSRNEQNIFLVQNVPSSQKTNNLRVRVCKLICRRNYYISILKYTTSWSMLEQQNCSAVFSSAIWPRLIYLSIPPESANQDMLHDVELIGN